MTPEQHIPDPAQAVPVLPWEPKQLATPADVARWLPPPRRRVLLPAVVRLGRRGGRGRGL